MISITHSALENLVHEAIELHKREKELTLRSTLIVGKLEQERAASRYGMSCRAFAEKIGLSENQYWKRAQAVRMMHAFPETKSMVEKGEVSISSLSLVSARLTQANKEVLLSGMKGKSNREIRELLSIVTLDGQILDKEPTVELKITCTKSQMAKLDRMLQVLSAWGHTPELSAAFEQAMDDLLWRRDPMQKAERAKQRAKKKAAAGKVMSGHTSSEKSPQESPSGTASPEKSRTETRTGGRRRRPAIPNAVRHQVWLRDSGQCTWRYPNGERCGEKKMLELDHNLMFCRGGGHTTNNLTLRCRYHNQVRAEDLLGREFMEKRRTVGC